jgi:dienelactone hydrolase
MMKRKTVWDHFIPVASGLSVLFAAVVPSLGKAEVSVEKFEYSAGGEKFEGLVSRPAGKLGGALENHPGILIVHNWMGVTKSTEDYVRGYAELGFVVLAADIYGKGVRPKDPKEAGALAGQFKGDRALFRKRLNLGLDELKKLKGVAKGNLFAAGYCFGGTGVIELARSGSDLKGVVSFHGGLDSPTPADGKNIKAKVLALHGADDPYVPAKEVEAFENEMRTNHIDWQLVKFGGAVHSFTDKEAGSDNSKGAAFNASANSRSWEITKAFFTELGALKPAH